MGGRRRSGVRQTRIPGLRPVATVRNSGCRGATATGLIMPITCTSFSRTLLWGDFASMRSVHEFSQIEARKSNQLISANGVASCTNLFMKRGFIWGCGHRRWAMMKETGEAIAGRLLQRECGVPKVRRGGTPRAHSRTGSTMD